MPSSLTFEAGRLAWVAFTSHEEGATASRRRAERSDWAEGLL